MLKDLITVSSYYMFKIMENLMIAFEGELNSTFDEIWLVRLLYDSWYIKWDGENVEPGMMFKIKLWDYVLVRAPCDLYVVTEIIGDRIYIQPVWVNTNNVHTRGYVQRYGNAYVFRYGSCHAFVCVKSIE
jgi:hypothetical protein